MSSAPIMPFVFPRQWTLDGLPLSGGKLYFYESGTTTPKVTYQEPTKSIINTNPVILDASGFAPIYLDTGYYTVILKDANEVQLFQPLNGIAGVVDGFGGGSDIKIVAVENYNALRNLQAEYDLVYVGGRTFNADGGEGWFYHDPNYQLSDDDGYILTSNAGATKYIRLNQEVLDPKFYGVEYGSAVNQYTLFIYALTRSVALGLPLVVNGNVYINQNIVVPTKANLLVLESGYFTSTAGITFTFTTGSDFSAFGTTFGQAVSPKFEALVVDNIKLSWMGGTVSDDRLNKLLASSTVSEQILEIDQTANIASTSYTTLASVKFTNNARLVISNSGGLTLSFPRILNAADYIFEINTSTPITSFNFGKDTAFPEWFGAVGNNSNDDSFPFWYSTLSGYTFLTTGKTYWLKTGTTTPGWPAAYRITGEGTVRLGNNRTLGNGQLWIYNATVVVDNSTLWFNGSWLKAISALFPSNYTATSSLIDGCVYTDKNKYPVYDGQPSIYNAHLPLLPSCQILGTDVTSKIVSAGPDLTLRNVSITSLTLTSATVDSLKPSKFAPIIATPTGTSATLSPAYSYNLIDNSAGQKDVILPSDPTAVYFKLIGKTGSNNIRVGCTGGDTFYTGATTFLINGSGVGVASIELFRVGSIWYPVFSQL
jgi:hypothetical protein